MSILLGKMGRCRRSRVRQCSTAGNATQRSTQGNERRTIENEIDTDSQSDEPEARCRQLREQHDAKSRSDDPGDGRPSPLWEPQDAGANRSEYAADDEKRCEHEGETVFPRKRVAHQQVAREAAQQCAQKEDKESAPGAHLHRLDQRNDGAGDEQPAECEYGSQRRRHITNNAGTAESSERDAEHHEPTPGIMNRVESRQNGIADGIFCRHGLLPPYFVTPIVRTHDFRRVHSVHLLLGGGAYSNLGAASRASLLAPGKTNFPSCSLIWDTGIATS